MSQDFVPPPPTRGTVDELDARGVPVRVTRAWSVWFDRIFAVVFAVGQSGTTAQRPTQGLWIGRPYFDVNLGYKVWWNGTAWVNAGGNPV